MALALAVLFPLFGKDHSLSSSWKSRRRRRIIRGRIAVVSLLLATIITELFPVEGLNVIVQGLLVTAAIMIPACLVHWFLSARYGDGRDEMATRRKRRSDEALSLAANEPSSATRRTKRSGSNELNEAPSESSGPQEVPVAARPQAPQAPDLTLVNSRPSVSSAVHKAASDDGQENVSEHLARVSNYVQSHDLDNAGYVAPDAPDSNRQARDNRAQRVASGAEMVPTSSHPSDLAKLSTQQIQELVTSLSKDKNRLQRLVIAQQASIESEREAHDQTRTLTRDAIKVMRSARAAQKHAEKLARRERSERQRIEQQYKKVASSLRNAMSIIEKRKASSGDSIPTLSSNIVVDKILS